MKLNGNSFNTGVVDFFAPSSRFVSASRIYRRLHRWWLVLLRYWWMLVVIVVAVTGAAYAYTTRSGPTYESKARMCLTGKINISGDQLYTEELINFLGTQAELLRSPAIQRRAMASLPAEFRPAPRRGVVGGGPDLKDLGKAQVPARKLFASGSAPGSNAPPPIP